MPIRRPDHGCHGYSSSQNSVPWAFSSLVVQHDQAPRLNRIQATSTRGVRARIRRVAGCAPPTGSAGHASATAHLKLTFHLDHSVGANHNCNPGLGKQLELAIKVADMIKKLFIIVVALAVLGAATGVALYYAYPVQVSIFGALTRNYLITLFAPSGTATTESNAAYKGAGTVTPSAPAAVQAA